VALPRRSQFLLPSGSSRPLPLLTVRLFALFVGFCAIRNPRKCLRWFQTRHIRDVYAMLREAMSAYQKCVSDTAQRFDGLVAPGVL